MGFLDKVKEVGNQAASSINDTVNKGQQSFNESQSRKASDALLRDLGALVYARDSGQAAPDNATEIERVTAAITAHVQSGGVLNLAVGPQSAPPPPADAAAPPPAPGAAATPPPPPAASTPPPPPPGAVPPPPPPGAVGGQ